MTDYVEPDPYRAGWKDAVMVLLAVTVAGVVMFAACPSEPKTVVFDRRVPLHVDADGGFSTLRDGAALSVPVLAWYDKETKVIAITEQGRLAGVRCEP